MSSEAGPSTESTTSTTSTASTSARPAVETRRQRHRRELIDELCVAAREQLQTEGSAGVTWRGLARATGMSPAALYTYFDSLDELLTEVILRVYGDLATAVAAALDSARDATVADRLLVGPLAYRRWALRHRAEFNLIFTDQLPGYAAPPGGPTVEAQTAVFRPMARVVAEARGHVPEGDPTKAPTAELHLFFGLFAVFHGLVSLEVNHHLDWLDANEMFESRLRWAIEACGLPAAGSGAVAAFDAPARRKKSS